MSYNTYCVPSLSICAAGCIFSSHANALSSIPSEIIIGGISKISSSSLDSGIFADETPIKTPSLYIAVYTVQFVKSSSAFLVSFTDVSCPLVGNTSVSRYSVPSMITDETWLFIGFSVGGAGVAGASDGVDVAGASDGVDVAGASDGVDVAGASDGVGTSAASPVIARSLI